MYQAGWRLPKPADPVQLEVLTLMAAGEVRADGVAGAA